MTRSVPRECVCVYCSDCGATRLCFGCHAFRGNLDRVTFWPLSVVCFAYLITGSK